MGVLGKFKRPEGLSTAGIDGSPRRADIGMIRRMLGSRIGQLLAISLVLTGCPREDSNKDTGADSGLTTESFALESGDTATMGTPQLAAGTQAGDGVENLGELANGDYIRVYERAGTLYYTSCAVEEDCYTATGQAINGLPSPLGIDGHQSGAFFEDTNGNNVFLLEDSGDARIAFVSGLSYNSSTGAITGTGTISTSHGPNGTLTGDGLSVFKIAGVPHAIVHSTGTTLRNLHTGADTLIAPSTVDPDDFDDCGTPQGLDDGTYITSVKSGSNCNLATAADLQSVQSAPDTSALASVQAAVSSGKITSPRAIGNLLSFSDADGRRWYVTTTTTPDGGSEDPVDSDGDGIADAEDNCPGVANGMQENLDGDADGDACDDDRDGDGVDNEEDNCPDDENEDQDDVDNDGVGDACDPNNDLTPQEMLEVDCPFAAGKVTIVEDSCHVVQDQDFEDIACNAEEQTVVLEGKCVLDVDLGGENLTRLEIDGIYGFNLENEFGSRFSGSVTVIDRGNKFSTIVDGIGLGPVGTTYGVGEMPPKADGTEVVHVFVDEGLVEVFDDDTGELIVELSAGEYANISPETKEVISSNGDMPDTREQRTQNQQLDNGQQPASCSSIPGKSGNPLGPVNLTVLTLALLAIRRRKVGEKSQ